MALRSEFEVFKQERLARETEIQAEIMTLRKHLASHRAIPSDEDTDTLVALAGSALKLAFPDAVSAAEPPQTQASEDRGRDARQLSSSVLQQGKSDDKHNESESEKSMELATPPPHTVILQDGDIITMMSTQSGMSPQTPPYAGISSLQSAELVVDPASISLPTTPVSGSLPSSPLIPAADRAAVIRDRPPTPFEYASSGDANQSLGPGGAELQAHESC